MAKRRNTNTIILHKEEDLANLSKRGSKSGQECKTDRRGTSKDITEREVRKTLEEGFRKKI